MTDKETNEIREWLVKIDQNQKHQTELLHMIKDTSDKALSKADVAEDLADKAYTKAERTEKDLERHIEGDKVERRWIIGLVASTILVMLPLITNFYM